MAWQNKNFAYSTLDGGVLIGASSIVVTTGANFPATGNFMCVIWDQTYANPSFDATRELVLCTARTTNTISVTRAQEGTSAKAWNSGDKVAHVYTAGILDTLVLLTEAQTLTNKTLTTPTIASMVNANHDHSAGAGGGVLPASSIGSGTLALARGGLNTDVSALTGLLKLTAGVASIMTAPGSTIVGISDSQSLSSKTLVAPTVSGLIAGPIENVAWTDYSTTSTVTGWSSYTGKTIFYKKVGTLVFVSVWLQGESNSTTAIFTLPYAMVGSGEYGFFLGACVARDNGTMLATPGKWQITGSTVNVYKDFSSAVWTASGTKAVVGNFWYITT